MQASSQFEATKKSYQLAETEARELKRELLSLRCEFVQRTGVNAVDCPEGELDKIEQKMCSIEEKLAHAEITEDETRTQAYPMATLGEDIREALNNAKLKVINAITHANKIQHHKHQNK